MVETFILVFDATHNKKLKKSYKGVVEKYLVWLSCNWSMDGYHAWSDQSYKGANT
jgi:hypothetical protein